MSGKEKENSMSLEDQIAAYRGKIHQMQTELENSLHLDLITNDMKNARRERKGGER